MPCIGNYRYCKKLGKHKMLKYFLDLPFYSFKKSNKLRKISRRIYKAQVLGATSRKQYEEGTMTLDEVNYGYDKKELAKVLDDFYKAREELFDFCENDRFIKEDIKHHGIDRKDLGYLFYALDQILQHRNPPHVPQLQLYYISFQEVSLNNVNHANHFQNKLYP